ncbi:MAG TPA: VIT and VWA domain-containing protein [Pyrinomonadaceae bacterium]|nr:VIT and VWA domain-containing protein [Pyrinomonadaceae bacterium]
MKNLIRTVALLLAAFHFTFAQSGVLIATSTNKPDEKVLVLQRMDVDILIDNQHANVKIVQIFDNKTSQTLEGKYLFALPRTSSIFDFATWENDLRIPGVMMEKRRANAIYAELKAPKVDPAILQQDEDTSAFSAKVFPINAYGTKRLELEYTEDLPIENLVSRFTFPLKASFGETQTVSELNLHLRVLSDFPISPIETKGYDLQVLRNEPNEYEAMLNAANVALIEDLSFAYKINSSENSISFITHRAPETISAYDLRDPNFANPNPDGYFESQAIFNQESLQTTQPKRVVILLDTSLSMYGDKLIRAVEATDFFLHNLNETDEFNLILFNDETFLFNEKPVPATAENVEKALQFLKGEALEGGTNLKKALQTSINQTKLFSNGERNIVLISDANPTLETTKTKTISKLFDNENARFFAFALGTDANELLLKDLCEKTHGDFVQTRETDDVALLLKTFFQKIGAPSVGNLRFNSNDSANFHDVYATDTESFAGSSFGFVGRYKQAKQTQINILGNFGGETLQLSKEVNLPEFDDSHGFLPRVWAKSRVNALLQIMNRDGEREDYIAEIIRLSEKYKFVTPYTAFIAAPRALLRPRLIQPGDPVIRLKTDASITQVFAVLPFGETLPMKFLADEGVWEVRFLAPATMIDGTYHCRILMTDKDGNGYQEEKSFVVDAHAPKPKINLEKKTFHTGEEVSVKVSSDKDTSKLIAKFYGAKPTQLFWSNQDKANVGKLKIPNNLAAGKYILTVTAEDFAHNLSTTEIEVEVL